MAITDLWEMLEADPPGTHTFFPGASKAQLAEAERQLQVRLPRSFARFLSLTGGARLFGEERILGVGPDSPPELDLVAQARALWADKPGLPRNLLPFGPTEDGVDCFLLSARASGGELPIVFWSPGGTVGEPYHDSFDEWLFEFTEGARAQLFEGDGLEDDVPLAPSDASALDLPRKEDG